MIKLLSISNLKSNILIEMAGAFLFILLLSGPGSAFAGKIKTTKADSLQKESISTQASIEIKYQAESVVHTLEAVLNSITFNDNTPSETANYINSSFTPNLRNRIFYSEKIIIEDDINPKFVLGRNRDLEVESYLNELDLNYQKTADFSIKFSNIKSSDVKKTNHIYVRVKFDETFASRYKVDGTPYPVRHREALIRMIPDGKKKWSAFIEGISYFNPALPIENIDHNLQIGEDNVVSSEEMYSVKPLLARNKMPVLFTRHTNNTNNTEQKVAEYPDFGIVFNKNLKAPDIKTVNPVFYLRVTFDSNFGSKEAEAGNATIQGEAVIRMERNGKNEWNAFVETVSFKKPAASYQDQDSPSLPTVAEATKTINNALDKTIKMAMLPAQTQTETAKKEVQKH